MRKTLATLILPVLIVLSAGSALAEKRVALVIGNSAYEAISALDNPRNDAELMREALEEVGFEVVLAKDATFSDMRRAIRSFGRKLRAGGKDAVGLFYYAGHGVQSRGGNYLIPIGAQVGDEADLVLETISTTHILRQMEGAGNQLNLVILDACRNNPFRSMVRSGTRGLSRITSASGTLVAFSAAPGQVAVDGTADNSPYTAALAKFIKEPGLQVEQLFKKVRNAVEDETGGRQTPWEESSLRGEFYFAGRSITVTEKPESKPEIKKQTNPTGAAFELSFWDTIKDSKDFRDFEAYLQVYPNGKFIPLAKLRLAKLQKQQQAALTKPTVKTEPRPEPEKKPEPKKKPKLEKSDNPAWLGVRIQTVTKEIAEAMDLKSAKGALIADITKGGPAETAGLKRGDIILSFDQQDVEGMRDLPEIVAATDAGKLVSVFVARKKGHFFLTVRLGSLADAQERAKKEKAEKKSEAPKPAEKPLTAFERNLASARKGDANAMFALAGAYEHGKEVKQDKAEALRWYRSAAENGHLDAMVRMGSRYEYGIDVARNITQAVYWYSRAADRDHVPAMYVLAAIHAKGIDGRHINPDKSARLAAKLLKLGNDAIFDQMIERSDAWGSSFRKALQRILKSEGAYAGAIDGAFGPGTKGAIRKYAGRS